VNTNISLGQCAYLVNEIVHPVTIEDSPYIGLEHIRQGTLHLNGHGSSKDVSSIKHKFKKGDILFGKLRPYFKKVIQAPFDGVCSTDIWVIRPNPGFHQRYIFYWMADQKFIDFSSGGSDGTKMPRAKWGHVSQFERPYLDYPTQEHIANILGTLDDKIELNQQMNQTLENMARAIFKSWFVDFDPVYAKMEGRDYPLPAEIMNLFPNELVDSELGMIPKGWKVGKLGEEFNIVMGQSPSGHTYNESGEGIPFYQGCKDFGSRFLAIRIYCNAPKKIANPGDSLVSVRAPIGDVNLASFKCCIGRGLAAVRHKSNSSSYTYYSMMQFKEHFKKFEADGTVFGSLNKTDFYSMKYIKPQEKIIEAFDKIIWYLDAKIQNNFQQKNCLEEIRDILLPELLINGNL